MEKKTIITVVISLLVVVLSVSFAWFSIEILGEHKEVTVNSKSLNIQFTNGDKISASNIEPGWSTTSSFKVTSNTDTTYNYNITLENYINTFVTNGYLQYKITSDNGGYNMTEYKDLPKSETSKNIVIAYNASIASGVT